MNRFTLLFVAAVVWLALAVPLCDPAMPVRGLHIAAPKPQDIPLAVRFIREVLPKEGVNLLVMGFGYRYQFTRRPEVAERDALSRADVRKILAACRASGVRLIPEVNLMGHQSMGRLTGALLRAHPEFDETPGRYIENPDVVPRSYCPLHPKIHEVVFDLIDEVAEACEADAFHVGMDEVFLIGENDCPRCRGKRKADLFAQEVRTLHAHLAKSNRTMWMWGDRFLDDKTGGVGNPDDGKNTTQLALRMIPKDIVICDWQYLEALPTPRYFAQAGFQVLTAVWRRPRVALRQLEMMRSIRMNAAPAAAERMQGMLQTTWCDFGAFANAYYGAASQDHYITESVACFRKLFRELRR